jgi:hypothetical protein
VECRAGSAILKMPANQCAGCCPFTLRWRYIHPLGGLFNGRYARPAKAPSLTADLTNHTCANLRLPTHGGLYAWDLEKGGRDLRVPVEGQLVFNACEPVLDAALAWFGRRQPTPCGLRRPCREAISAFGGSGSPTTS